jgi:hypothetical protein
VNRGTELKQKGEALLVEMRKAIEIQRQETQRLRRTLSKPGAPRSKARPG